MLLWQRTFTWPQPVSTNAARPRKKFFISFGLALVVLPAFGGNAELCPFLGDADGATGTTASLVIHPHHALGASVDVVDGRSHDVGSAGNRLTGRLVDIDRGVFFVLVVRVAHNRCGGAASQDGKNQKDQKMNIRFHDNLLVKVYGNRSSQ